MTRFGKLGFSKTQRYLFLVALFAIVLGLIFYGIFQYNLTRQGRNDNQEEKKAEGLLGEAATSTISFLNGLPVPITSTSSCVAVMIDNAPEVEQQFGLNAASLVYEAPVEGGRTRFMAIYHLTTSTPVNIGPVRSARPYFLDWVQELNCLYAHVGGSQDALDQIKTAAIFDLNEFYNGGYFWRDKRYVAPHSTFTSVEDLSRAFSKEMEKWKGRQIRSWLFTKDKHDVNKKPVEAVALSRVGGWQVSWKYNRQDNTWERWVDQQADLDENKKVIKAKNVVIQYVRTKVLDEEGRLDIVTTDGGRAVILKNGYEIEGRWWKKGPESRTLFFGPDTKEIDFEPGTIWIEVEPG